MGVAIGIVYTYLPLMILPLYVTLERIDPALLAAASDLGASPWRVLRRVVLPLATPGIVAGCILVGIPATGEYVIPQILGGDSTLMFGNVGLRPVSRDRQLSGGSRYGGDLDRGIAARPEAAQDARLRRGGEVGMNRRFPRAAGAITAGVMLMLYAPIAVVLVYSVNRDPLLIHWRGFTMHWYSAAFHDPQVRSDVVTSTEVAAMSTALALLIAITAGLWAREASRRGRRALDSLTYARIILPEVVFALGLFVLMSKLGIGYGVLAIVAGHVVFNSAYATVIIQARLSTLGVGLEEAAADLGSEPVARDPACDAAVADARRSSSRGCWRSASRSTM